MADIIKTYNLEDFLDDIDRYCEDAENDTPVVIAVQEDWGVQLYSVADMEVTEFRGTMVFQIAVGEAVR